MKSQTFEGGKEVRSGFFGYGTNVAETLKSPEIAIFLFLTASTSHRNGG